MNIKSVLVRVPGEYMEISIFLCSVEKRKHMMGES